MNKITTEQICRYYLDICLSDWHKADLALKALDAIVSGGEKKNKLERMFSDVDSAGIVRAASFRMNMANGGGDDPLARAIVAISD